MKRDYLSELVNHAHRFEDSVRLFRAYQDATKAGDSSTPESEPHLAIKEKFSFLQNAVKLWAQAGGGVVRKNLFRDEVEAKPRGDSVVLLSAAKDFLSAAENLHRKQDSESLKDDVAEKWRRLENVFNAWAEQS